MFETLDTLTVEELEALIERGGPTHAENLTLSCRRCNLSKGTRPAYRFAVTRAML